MIKDAAHLVNFWQSKQSLHYSGWGVGCLGAQGAVLRPTFHIYFHYPPLREVFSQERQPSNRSEMCIEKLRVIE